ncbi:phasin PhaH [Caulobacter sp. BP25]|uniref:phasin PhaH n=1 Tax=Caulobacter sp. BP25 TaxID=2048900 RepID=UPI000C12CA6B|nr:phasin PhaH [Caulobacter sp. BP25]PHY21791.1 hypothetical protein CSW59_03780 [Caulobacter sp. BP25]
MVSSSSFFPAFDADKIEPGPAPRFAMGAASPLWMMFGGAAVAGATYWWWASRWREAVNLEAVLALAPEPVAPAAQAQEVLETTPEPIVEVVALAVETTEAVIDAVEETTETLAEATLVVAEAAQDATTETVEALTETLSETLAETTPVEATSFETAPVETALVEDSPVEPAVEVAEVISVLGDDLTRLVGVGPKLAASLAEQGVTTFSQIAAWTPEELAEVDLKLGLKGRAERDAWVAQAKRFAASAEAQPATA